MANFGWYLDLANRITAEVEILSPEFQRKKDEMFKQSKRGVWSWMHKFAQWRVKHPRLTIIILFTYFMIMTWIPFLVVIFWMKSIPLFP